MSAQTVITHALKPGTRVRYTGTQSWGPHTGAPLTDAQRVELYTVTVVRPWGGPANPWGGLASPLYVVQLADGRTYVAAEAELSPIPARGVSLAKRGLVTPGTRRVRVPEFILAGRRGADVDRAVSLGPIGVGPMLERNDLRALACTLRVMAMFGGER